MVVVEPNETSRRVKMTLLANTNNVIVLITELFEPLDGDDKESLPALSICFEAQ